MSDNLNDVPDSRVTEPDGSEPPGFPRTKSTSLIRANLEMQWRFGQQMELEDREERERRDSAP